MKNFKKVLALSIAALILLKNNAYATTSSSGEFNVMKIGLLALAVLLIAVVLYLSYKNDSPSEIKTKTTKAPKASRKDSLKEELAEKDNTYEVEEDESYEDDSIEPVSIGKDEDEISLFESVNNPDTVKEEKEEPVYEEEEEEVVGFVTKANVEKGKKSNSSRFERYTPTKEDDDTVNDFFSMDDEEDDKVETDINILNNSDEEVIEDSEEYDYEYEEEEKSTSASESGTMVFDSSELNSKIDILNGSDEEEEIEETVTEDSEEDYNYDYDFDFDNEEKEEVEEKVEEKEEEKEKEEDLFAGVKEEPTEFVGFTTIKPKEKTRGGNSRFERPNYSKMEEDILNGNVKKEDDEGNSANDFLAQMAKNLGGEEVKTEPAKKTAAKKTTTTAKKTTAAKKTTTSKTKTTKK